MYLWNAPPYYRHEKLEKIQGAAYEKDVVVSQKIKQTPETQLLM